MSLRPILPDWPAPPGVRAACSTREGGVSTGLHAGLNLGRSSGDDPAAVAENRRLLAAALGLPRAPAWLQQVHGTRVVELPCRDELPEADAAFTTQPGVVVCVQAADCLPVLFCADDASVVAGAHAGWRGLCGGVLESTVAALPVAPNRLIAWLGPAIGPEAFEVGDEVRAAFVAVDPTAAACFRDGPASGKQFADLFALARQRLAAAGVSRIHGGGISTHADPARFYSFRRDGICGRMAALIWIDPSR
ncbi:MAG: peptidoglycan editing factor PgeF [Xanthomonadaceae bacterium]|nr:peptidoglycan editing factor PgeF [Xanthomonadaceae bacterium]